MNKKTCGFLYSPCRVSPQNAQMAVFPETRQCPAGSNAPVAPRPADSLAPPCTPVHRTGPVGPKMPVFEPTLHLAWTGVLTRRTICTHVGNGVHARRTICTHVGNGVLTRRTNCTPVGPVCTPGRTTVHGRRPVHETGGPPSPRRPVPVPDPCPPPPRRTGSSQPHNDTRCYPCRGITSTRRAPSV